MIINHTHKFVFVHVPKAAGTTVTVFLSGLSRYRDLEIGGTLLGEAAQPYYFKRFGLRKHSSAEEIRNVMGASDYDQYFSFSFVRNPFSRLVSAFYFLKSWGDTPSAFLEDFAKIDDVRSFLDSDIWTSKYSSRGPDSIFSPQVSWLYSQGESPELLVKYVGMSESLNSGLDEIADRIGAADYPRVIQNKNVSRAYGGDLVWKSSVVDRVFDEYRADFLRFGYPLEPPVVTGV